MNATTRRLLALSIPVVLLAAIWGLNWRRLYPAPTLWDTRCRATLLGADRIRVTVANEATASGALAISMTDLKPDAMVAVVTNLNVTQSGCPCVVCGRCDDPRLEFTFYKAGHVTGVLAVSDHEYTFIESHVAQWTLHPSSAHRLREFIQQHPHIEKVARIAGVDF